MECIQLVAWLVWLTFSRFQDVSNFNKQFPKVAEALPVHTYPIVSLKTEDKQLTKLHLVMHPHWVHLLQIDSFIVPMHMQWEGGRPEIGE